VTKRKLCILINAFLIVLTLVFIWSRSLKTIPESRAESESFLALISPFLEFFVGKGNATDHLVRKLAHFCEYGLLGAEFGVLFLQCFHARLISVIVLLFSGFLSGAIDENIQYFTGRGNQFSDVLLDFSGCIAGAIGIMLLASLYRKYADKKTR